MLYSSSAMLRVGRVIGRTRLLRFGIRDRLLRILFPPQARFDFPFETRIGKARYAGNLDNYLDWSVYFYGQYERGLLAFISHVMSKLGERPVFWDIGANTGQHALFAAGMGAKVEAFEPFAPVREKFVESLALNPALQIRLHPFGLGEFDHDARFVAPTNENLGTGHFADNGGIVLSVRHGDDVSAEPPSLMKIDVEGFEGSVLRGLRGTLERHRPIVICEYSERTKAQHGDIRDLLPSRYDTFVIAGAERWRLDRYTGAGRGENLLFLPTERSRLIGGYDHSSPTTAQ